jgi:hypothetical protein
MKRYGLALTPARHIINTKEQDNRTMNGLREGYTDFPRARRVPRMLAPMLLLLALLALLAPAAPPAQARADTGEVVVVVWPVPNVVVKAGDILAYQIQVKNFNRDAHSNIRVYIPYDENLMTIEGTAFEPGSDVWVSELSKAHILLTFPEISGGHSRIATVYARVNSNLPEGTVITTWPSYSWNDSRSQNDPRSANAAPVVVGPSNELSPYVWMGLDPAQASAGVLRVAFSDRFMPFEEVEATLLIPGYEPRIIGTTNADSHGRVWFSIGTESLPPGRYDVQLRGLFTNLQAAAGLRVE